MTSLAHLLLLATILTPLALLATAVTERGRARLPGLLAYAPLPGLCAAVIAGDAPPLVIYADWLRLSLGLDAPGALLLGVAALLWSAAGAYASACLPGAKRFAGWWLLTLAGSLGVFVAGDLVTFYFAFALVSLAAYGLVVHDATARARRAGAIYLALAVLGEVFLLFAFALLAVSIPGESLAIADAVAALPNAPLRDVTILLLLLGFGLKAGLVPLHVWLPLAHPAAPMPASAVLSGAIIKAGIIGLIRFLPFEGGIAGWGTALGALGLLTAFYGVALGVTQRNPKTILAYSSVSQMGVVMAALGFGLAAGDAGTPLDAARYASHHVLAKGALFLGVGVALATGARRAAWVMAPVLLLALSFGGLPFSGGALAKEATKAQLGAGVLGWLSALSAAGTTMLMLHFAARLRAGFAESSEARAGLGLILPFAVMTAAALLLPWWLYAAPVNLWPALWPVLLGALGFLALRAFEARLPRPPEGDLLVFAEAAASRIAPPLAARAARIESRLRAWPSAGLALLGLLLALILAMALAA
ncbi:proton-conducting transporter membrane subunit [Sediminicoccus sp. BL-A-41-H5]|uniref:proton-conducting transporter transmembrane domain-containing protein n=1 Tax=Sediminicoccus sp. BL-A-41-H5 TaxID=3421106 RepID=UPI003D666CF8